MQIYFPNNQTWRLPEWINSIIPYDRQNIMHLWHGKIVLVLQRKRKDICPRRQYNRPVYHQITMSFQKPWIQIMYSGVGGGAGGNSGTTSLASVALDSHILTVSSSLFAMLKAKKKRKKRGILHWDSYLSPCCSHVISLRRFRTKCALHKSTCVTSRCILGEWLSVGNNLQSFICAKQWRHIKFFKKQNFSNRKRCIFVGKSARPGADPDQNFLKRETFPYLTQPKESCLRDKKTKKIFIIMHSGAMRLAPIAAPKVEQQEEPMRWC